MFTSDVAEKLSTYSRARILLAEDRKAIEHFRKGPRNGSLLIEHDSLQD